MPSFSYNYTFANTYGDGCYHFQVALINTDDNCTLATYDSLTNPTYFTSTLGALPVCLTIGESATITFTCYDFTNTDGISVLFNWLYVDVGTSSGSGSSFSSLSSIYAITDIRPTEAADCELFTFVPNRVEQSIMQASSIREAYNYNFGAQEIDAKQAVINLLRFKFSFIFADDSEIYDIVDFYKSKWGNVKSFCLPSWQDEFILSESASAGDTALTINDVDDLAEGDELYFYIENGSNEYFTAGVSNITGNIVTIDTAIPVALESDFGISKIYRVSFAEPSLTINQETESVATCELSFIQETRVDASIAVEDSSSSSSISSISSDSSACSYSSGTTTGEAIVSNYEWSDVVYYNAGVALAAGSYTITYMGGAICYNDSPDCYAVNNHFTPGYGYRIIYNNGATSVAAPGLSYRYDTQCLCEQANDALAINITHTGGTIGIYLNDLFYGDNRVNGSSAPVYALVFNSSSSSSSSNSSSSSSSESQSSSSSSSESLSSSSSSSESLSSSSSSSSESLSSSSSSLSSSSSSSLSSSSSSSSAAGCACAASITITVSGIGMPLNGCTALNGTYVFARQPDCTYTISSSPATTTGTLINSGGVWTARVSNTTYTSALVNFSWTATCPSGAGTLGAFNCSGASKSAIAS